VAKNWRKLDMSSILKEEKDGIIYIDFNSPPLNILNLEKIKETIKVLDEERKAKVIALKGKGKVFCAGVDVRDHLPGKVEEMLETFAEMIYRIFEFPGIVASIVHGGAYGGGCEIALCSDIVIAEKDAIFSQPEVKLGVFPPVACAVYPLLFPSKVTNYLIYSGENLKAHQLKEYGIVNEIFEKESLFEDSQKYLEKFKELSRVTLKYAKKASSLSIPLLKERISQANRIYLEELMSTEDAKEGLYAFLEKRKPIWKEK